jgi:acetyltransferase-like isoleucine patch superfamily enzyme
MISRHIRFLAVACENLLVKLSFRLHRVKIGHGCRFKGLPYIRNAGVFKIGSNVRLNSRMSANPIGGDCRSRFVIGFAGSLFIGNNVGLSNTTINAYCDVLIQDDVMIGGGTKIYDTDFHSLEPAIRLGEDNDISTKPVLIKSGAFIGAHCIVLKGVTIGQYSIIGAGSVVTKDIPDWEIWAGNPAKFIRRIKPTIAVSN